MKATRIDVKGYVVGEEIFVVDPRSDEVREIKTGREVTEGEWRAIQECLQRYALADRDPTKE